MKLKSADKKFIEKLNRVIEDGTYDDLDMAEWEIIEMLLQIIEAYTRE